MDRPGPPPRPPVTVAPLALGAASASPRLLYASGCCWLISALLAVPTAVYARSRFDLTTAAFFVRLNRDVVRDQSDLDAARTLADRAPSVVTAAVVVLVVVQLGLVALLIVNRSRAARWLLALAAVAGSAVLVAWYYLLFQLGTESSPIYQLCLVGQLLLVLVGAVLMFAPPVSAWLRARPTR